MPVVSETNVSQIVHVFLCKSCTWETKRITAAAVSVWYRHQSIELSLAGLIMLIMFDLIPMFLTWYV